jgi:hypothetical protein
MLLLAVNMFTGCGDYIIDETGAQQRIMYGHFIKLTDNDSWVDEVYDIDSHVVYYLQHGGHGGFLAPKLIYQDGAIYGCIYENGEYIAVPYGN